MNSYTLEEKEVLRRLAKESIIYGLKNKFTMQINLDDYPEKLREWRACFVTLQIDGQLRGCIGTLVAYQSLVHDVVINSYEAAFNDPRFEELAQEEFAQIEMHISILNKPEPIEFQNEDDLINQLRVGIDGLIFIDNGHRATFLPSVWEQLPDPVVFLRHLKLKAGFPENYWSESIKIERYTVENA